MYKSIYKYSCLLILCLYATGGFAEKEQNIYNVDDTILEGSLLGDSIVQDFQVYLKYLWVKIDSTDENTIKERTIIKENKLPGTSTTFFNFIEKDIILTVDGSKIRCEEKYDKKTLNNTQLLVSEVKVYDGEISRTLKEDYIPSISEKRLSGIISPANNTSSQFYNPVIHGLFIMGTPVAEFLQGITRGSLKEFDIKDVCIIGEETKDDISCVVARADLVYDQDHGKLTAWLAPKMMYRPIHIELQLKDYLKIKNIKYREIEESIWFPKHINWVDYKFDTHKGGNKPIVSVTITIQDSVIINQKFTDDIFSLTFPKGIKITDHRIQESYTSR